MPISKQKGVAAVELAILLIPMLMIVFGATELGRALYQYNTLLKSARDATRYLTVVPLGTGQEEARCLALYGRFDAGAAPGAKCAAVTPLLDQMTPEMVQIPAPEYGVPTGAGSINLVRVVITGYVFSSLVPFIVPDITLGPVTVTMRHG